MPPRAAYVHVPFCRHRCGYCNFTLIAGRDDLIEGYLKAIERELSQLGAPQPVDTLFLGGGTPTHLAPRQLAELLTIVLRWHPLAADAEFSVEGNPCDLTTDLVETLAEVGVNRLSLGVQSFRDPKLTTLERDHRADDIARAVEQARTRIQNVALDLIFATPGETVDQWRDDLESALAVQPNHLSTYGLTWEKGTSYWARLHRSELRPVPEEDELAMYLAAIDTLTSNGFEHYEVSNFALPGRRCRHNQNYWLGGEYFAAGPGAARFVGGRRETNHRSVTAWLKRIERGDSPVADSETLTPEQRARELLVFGLRRLEGLPLAWFRERTGFDAASLGGRALARYLNASLLEIAADQLRLTRSGLVVSDSLWPELLVP
ncbi:MAG: radical SAM family heme chaperone HemW [Planctomycetales bacterium]|nr:radical SAM family heme chaperone HemW [Planctomycetales bacterium]